MASLYATLEDASLISTIRDDIGSEDNRRLGITHTDGLLIARYLGDSTEQARNSFKRIWRNLRPIVLNRPVCEPRIWNT
jgi:urease accessory protein